MLDDKRSRSISLMQEVASISTLQGSGSVSVQLVDINVKQVSFTVPDKLISGPSSLVSIRFTLPGTSRLHFALVRLSPTITHELAGYRYSAEFVRTEPKTIDHIVQCVSPAQPEATSDAGRLYPS